MKKVLIGICSVLLVFSTSMVRVYALENDMVEEVAINVTIDEEKGEKTVLTSLVNNSVLYEIYDIDSDELVFRATFTEQKMTPLEVVAQLPVILPMGLADQYNVFPSNWSYRYKRTMTVDWTLAEELAIGYIEEAISAFFALYGIGWLWDAASLAVTIYNYRYDGLYCNFYTKVNLYCSILQHERYDLYYDAPQPSFVRTEYNEGVWTGNPYDYTGTVETACRFLTEIW